jgi:hypothetical protein
MFRSALLVAGFAAVLWVSGPEGACARETGFRKPLAISLHDELRQAPDRRIVARLEPAKRSPTQAAEELAQAPASQDQLIQQIEKRGYSKITGVMRRGQNYVFQAVDPFGERVRVVMNAQTGEIVGLSRIMLRKK